MLKMASKSTDDATKGTGNDENGKDDAKKEKDDAKKGKDDAKKGKDDAKKGMDEKRDVVETRPSILDNEMAKNLGKLVCIILTVTSIALTIMFEEAYVKFKEVPDAMASLRSVMVQYNRTLEGKTDDVVLKAAEDMAQYVLDRRSDIAELQYEIEYTNRLIHEGWRIYNRTYWYFTKPTRYDNVVRECAEKGLKLQKIEDIFFQKFLETQLLRHRTGIWIPMKKRWIGNHHEWYWDTDKTLVTKMYWELGQPSHVPNAYCCEIKIPCSTPNYCWHDIHCNVDNVGFCRGREVDRRWLLT